MQENNWQADILRDRQRERTARRILGVSAAADAEQIRRAWRSKSLAAHPDSNPENPAATREFVLVNCAYRYLTEGEGCEELDRHEGGADDASAGHSAGDNPWAYFAWWRDNYFQDDSRR